MKLEKWCPRGGGGGGKHIIFIAKTRGPGVKTRFSLDLRCSLKGFRWSRKVDIKYVQMAQQVINIESLGVQGRSFGNVYKVLRGCALIYFLCRQKVNPQIANVSDFGRNKSAIFVGGWRDVSWFVFECVRLCLCVVNLYWDQVSEICITSVCMYMHVSVCKSVYSCEFMSTLCICTYFRTYEHMV